MTTQSGGRTYVVGQLEVRHESNRIAREVQAILPKLKVHADGSRALIYPWQDEYRTA